MKGGNGFGNKPCSQPGYCANTVPGAERTEILLVNGFLAANLEVYSFESDMAVDDTCNHDGWPCNSVRDFRYHRRCCRNRGCGYVGAAIVVNENSSNNVEWCYETLHEKYRFLEVPWLS